MQYCLVLFTMIISLNSFSMGSGEISSLAVERSSSLNAQEMETRALQSEAGLKGRWQNPQLMGQFGSLKSGNTRGSTVEISVTQPIPLSDKFSLRKEITLTAMENQKKQTEFFKQWVSHQAILATWKLYVSGELLKHGVDRTKRLGLVKMYLETRPRVTIKQRVELSIITSMLYQLEKMQDEKKHAFEVAKSDLEFWIGKSLSESEIPFSLPDKYEFVTDSQIDTSKDIELSQAKNTVKIAQMDYELATKERRPDLFFGGGYRVENVTPVNHFSYAIVGLNIPLWDTGLSRLETAKVREMRDKKNLEETERKLLLKHQHQTELVNLNVEQLKRFPKKFIRLNEQAIHEAEIGFRQGLVDVNTFLLAETQSHEVIDQVFISWISYLENLSSLQLMKGKDFNWELK
jgi:Outer membrane efflux protein